MPRRTRIHVAGGTYYVVRRTNSPSPVFSRPENYAMIECLLPAALRRAGALLHGHCWMPDAIHLVLRIGASPLGTFMSELTSRYSHYAARDRGERGTLFGGRYGATLIDPDAYLLPVIHHLHYLPVVANIVQSPEEYPHSSHHAYLGSTRESWVHTRTALQLLDCQDDDRVAYRRLLANRPSDQFLKLFENGHRGLPRILGRSEFIAGLPRPARPARSALSLGEIDAYVCRVNDITHAQLVSRSGRHHFVLARAQIAWYATERGIASLNEVALYLKHSASGLTRAIARYQKKHPELFTHEAFAALIPLVPRISGQSLWDMAPSWRREADARNDSR